MPLDFATVTLLTIVGVFWLLVILTARSRGRQWFPNILIVAGFFFGVGMLLNKMHPMAGTYIIGGIHALLLIMLGLKLASQKAK